MILMIYEPASLKRHVKFDLDQRRNSKTNCKKTAGFRGWEQLNFNSAHRILLYGIKLP